MLLVSIQFSQSQTTTNNICCPDFKFTLPQIRCDFQECTPKNSQVTGDHNPIASYPICKYSTQTISVSPGLSVGFTYNWTVVGGTILGPPITTTPYIVINWGNGSTGSVSVFITNNTGCNKKLSFNVCLVDAPKPKFTINTSHNVCTNQPITFTGTVIGTATNTSWNFGDGTIVNNINPIAHSFSAAGTYFVTYTANNIKDSTNCGCTNTFTDTIYVNNNTGLQILEPSCKKMFCAGDTITYCSSVVCTSYNWGVIGGSFVGGVNNTNCVKVIWNPSSGTQPSVGLKVAGCAVGCSDTATLLPKVLFNGMPITGNANVCVGAVTTLSIQSLPGVFYYWSISPLSGTSVIGASINTTNFSASFSIAGTYTITCKYIDSIKGCSGTSSFTVNVKPKLSIGGTTTTCEGCTANFNTISSPTSVNWFINPPTTSLGSGTSASYTFPTGSAGTYLVSAVNATAYCNSPQTMSVIVAPKPVLSITQSATVACPGTIIKFYVTSSVQNTNVTWTVPSGCTILANTGNILDTLVVQYNGAPFTVTATQLCEYNCTSTAITASVSNPGIPVIVTPITSVCVDDVVTYTATSLPALGDYNWSISNTLGTITSGQGTGTITVLWHGNPGAGNTGTITATNCSGSSTSVTINVSTPIFPKLTFTGDLCAGNSVTIYSSAGAGTVWSPSPPASPATGASTVTNVAGVYAASFTSGTCTKIAYFNVRPCGQVCTNCTSTGGSCNATCDATFTATPNPTCSGENVSFTALQGGYQIYYWQFGDGNIAYANPTAHTYINNTSGIISYTATLTITSFLGCTHTTTQTIFVHPKPIVTITKNDTICPGSFVTLNSSINQNGNTMCTSYNYQWFLNGSPILGANSATYMASNYGSYSLNISGGIGCNCKAVSDTVLLSWYAKPKAIINANSTICFNAAFNPITTLLSAVSHPSINTFSWSSNAGISFAPSTSTSNVTNYTHTFVNGVNFSIYLAVIDTNGCMDYDTLCVYPFENPTVNIASTSSLCSNQVNVLNVVSPVGSLNYSWNNGVVGTQIITSLAGSYTATATDLSSGCTSNSNPIIILNSASTALFPIGCDTICRDSSITIPLAQLPNVNTYNVQWYDGIKPAGTLISSGYGNITIPGNTLSIGLHHLWVIVNNGNGCNDTSGVFDVYIKNCITCNCNGSSWAIKTYTLTTSPPSQPIDFICNQDINIACKPITINAIYNCADTVCNGNVLGVIKNNLGVVINNITSLPYTYTPVSGTVATYTVTLYGYCGGKKCDSCVLNLIIDCPNAVPPCLCNKQLVYFTNSSITTTLTKATVGGPLDYDTTVNFSCGTSISDSINCNKLYKFNATFTKPANWSNNCPITIKAVITLGTSTIIFGPTPVTSTSALNYTFTAAGSYCVKYYLYVNTVLCDSCSFCFKVKCPSTSPPCNCQSTNFTSNPSVSFSVPKGGGLSVKKLLSTPCNTSMAAKLNCGTPYNFFINSPLCSNGSVTAELTTSTSSTVIASQTNVSPSNPLAFTFSGAGTFCVKFKLIINGVVCKTCTMCFTVCCNYYPLPDITSTLLGCTIGGTTIAKADSVGGIWEMPDNTIASVHSTSGSVTALAVGVTPLIYNIINKGCWYYIAKDYTVSTVAAPQQSTGASSVCVGSTILLSNATLTPNAGRSFWSSVAGIATVSTQGVVTGNSKGIAKIRYTVANSLGCTNFTDKDIAVNAIPATPIIGYKAPFSNPQKGAPTGGFCVGKIFGVMGSPVGGVWSKTGCISVTQAGIATINTTGVGSLTYTFNDGSACSNFKTMSGVGYVCATRLSNGQSLENERAIINEFTIYPNPAKNTLNVIANMLKGIGKYEIIDVLGKKLQSNAIGLGNTSINISNLSKGLYTIIFITKEGRVTKKFIVE